MQFAERTAKGTELFRARIHRFIESRMDTVRGGGFQMVGERELDVLIP